MKKTLTVLLILILILSVIFTINKKDISENTQNLEPIKYESAIQINNSVNFSKLDQNVSLEERKNVTKENSTEFEGVVLVSITPKTAYVNSLKGKSADDYYIVADDFNYYTSEFDEFLKDKEVQTKISDSDYLILKDGEKKYYFDTRKKPLAIFSTILFKPGKEPVLMNGVDIKGAYNDYFK